MKFLNYVVIFSFLSLGVTVYSADCSDNDKVVVRDCYNTHLAFYNYTSRIYEYVFTVLRFSTVEGKNNCTIFEALGNCIGQERFNACVTPELLGKILGKSVDDAKDLIYIYHRFRIYCFYFPELIKAKVTLSFDGVNTTGCYDAASINSCAYDRLSHQKIYSAYNCPLFPAFLNCSLQLIAARCYEPYAQMHCDFMNLIVATYHTACGIQPFKCSKYNFSVERILGTIEYNRFEANLMYFGLLYATHLDPVFRGIRYFYASIFIALFVSTFKKNSPIKSSFFAIFLIIPFYDILYVLYYILVLIPFMSTTLYNWGVLSALNDCYVTLFPAILCLMSFNRFTAINFPVKHGKIWNSRLTSCLISLLAFLTIAITLIERNIQNSANSSLTSCLNQRSLQCTLRESFDMKEVLRGYKIFRCIWAFSMCGISVILFCATFIRYELCLKNQVSDILKTAEKRLFVITFVEVILTILYTVFHYFPVFVMNYQLIYLISHSKPIVFLHHFSSIALFLLFSKATRTAYFQFFYLDFLYKKFIQNNPISKFTKSQDRVVTLFNNSKTR